MTAAPGTPVAGGPDAVPVPGFVPAPPAPPASPAPPGPPAPPAALAQPTEPPAHLQEPRPVPSAPPRSAGPARAGRALDDRQARGVLSAVAEPGDGVLAAAVAALGAAEVVDLLAGPEERAGSALRPLGASVRRLAGWRGRLPGAAAVPRSLDELAALGLVDPRLLVPGDAEWPTQLGDLDTRPGGGGRAPLCLWAHGPLALRPALLRSVSVVGARAASAYGEHVTVELAAGLSERGWTVVSGAAYGVDGAAHRAALAADGATVAVLACGPDVAYPRAHAHLLRRVGEQGAVVSELPPGTPVSRSRLLQRNRLVAAMTRGTVVVEAAVRSGTASTAAHAAAVGRVVMAVPGPVTSATSAGCHELLRSGRAVLVAGADHVVDAAGLVGDDACTPPRAEARPADGLPGDQLRVLDALPARRWAGLAAVAREAGLDLPAARAALGALLAAGLAEPGEDGYRVGEVLRAGRRPA